MEADISVLGIENAALEPAVRSSEKETVTLLLETNINKGHRCGKGTILGGWYRAQQGGGDIEKEQRQ